MTNPAGTFALHIRPPAEDAKEIEDLAAHMLTEHDETLESLTELVEDFIQRHPGLSVLDAIDAVHMFQTDAAAAGDWDAGHTH